MFSNKKARAEHIRHGRMVLYNFHAGISIIISDQVHSAYALACITLAHPDNQKLLLKEKFTFTLLIDLLYSSAREVSVTSCEGV